MLGLESTLPDVNRVVLDECVGVDGKHLIRAGTPLHIKGVTYGSFRRRADGALYPEHGRVVADFRAMAAAGVNTVRIYTLPPRDLLEAADAHGLSLIVGLHYDDWRMETRTGRTARRRIYDAGRAAVDETLERCQGHRSVLALAVGNEVPSDLVRLHGAGHVEDTLSALISRVHQADENLLATYVNFPTTEFLDVEGQDFICFNVFLEQPDALRSYLRHLQIVAGDKPLVLTELGLASQVHGQQAQTDSLAWQLDLVTETGCAGACVFSWTDEWAVNDHPVEGWGFGLTTTDRQPKPALDVVGRWARSSVKQFRSAWPRLSVVVCAHNEERTIEECLESLTRTDYPNLEVIVCVDGSTDRTHELAAKFPFRVLDLPHGGLSRARNLGLEASTGEIVAYLDADAACHPEWPFYLALSFEDPGVVATGGPNLPFPEAGVVERAVAKSPGDPVEVLIGDDRAEHVPGCNMAFRKDALQAIDGFNVACTAAGDDVDVCWRLLDSGHQIAFAAAAQVRHHRRHTVRGYLKQQIGYGRAEKMLSGAHPHRFNGLGQARWEGVVYAKARFLPSLLRPVVYYGYQGASPFQSVTRRPSEMATGWIGAHLPLLTPLALLGLALSVVSAWWLLLPATALVSAAVFAVAVALGLRVGPGEHGATRLRLLSGALHVAQPFVRLWGRLRGVRLDLIDGQPVWQGDRHQWLRDLLRELQAGGMTVEIGGPDKAWDLEVRRGSLVAMRLTTAVVWSWEPRHRLQWRLRRPAALSGLAAIALGGLDPRLSALALVAGLALVLWQTIDLRSRLRRALARSTGSATPAYKDAQKTTLYKKQPERPDHRESGREVHPFNRRVAEARDRLASLDAPTSISE